MSYIDQIFRRCDISEISSFILYGSEGTNEIGSYEERIKNAFKGLDEFLKKEYPDLRECDEKSSFITSFVATIESIYMEVGLQAGLILSAQIFGNKNKAM